MKAVVYKGKNKVAVEEVSDPKIAAPGDAIIRKAYAHFDHRGVGKGKDWTKVLLKPGLEVAA